MFSPARRALAMPGGFRYAAAAVALAVVFAGCSSAAATTGPASSVAGTAGTPAPSIAATDTATAAASLTATVEPVDTAAQSPVPTAAPTPAPTPVPKPKPTPTALPALAIGLCTGAQLSLSLTLWEGDTGTSYAHVTATNVSSASCNMRGSSRAQIIDGNGSIIGDAGSAGAEVTTKDPVYTVAPNGQVNTIVTWGNWCKPGPAQKVTVQMSLAFGLGRIKAPPLGDAPIPTCYASGQSTMVSSEGWLP